MCARAGRHDALRCPPKAMLFARMHSLAGQRGGQFRASRRPDQAVVLGCEFGSSWGSTAKSVAAQEEGQLYENSDQSPIRSPAFRQRVRRHTEEQRNQHWRNQPSTTTIFAGMVRGVSAESNNERV